MGTNGPNDRQRQIARSISALFPEIQKIGGVRPVRCVGIPRGWRST
ncbi:hypothetical protein I553_0967 [Mycobacterium xenopi 4042]|uniref:Uncharacterized protein n=1 Tax=Mycobacterium xenopi 4042 TaxID=1299334 RepID=X7Z904_MYCXE|nr:hypothetical protein I553_0967 [Mycobacterium xenopi 4042]